MAAPVLPYEGETRLCPMVEILSPKDGSVIRYTLPAGYGAGKWWDSSITEEEALAFDPADPDRLERKLRSAFTTD